MTFPRYPEYKDSGVEWLGEVPGHWDATAIKRISSFVYGDALPSEVRNEDGGVPVYGSNGSCGQHDEANTESPVILIGRKGSCGALNWSNLPAFAIDTVYFVDPRNCKNNLRWFFWALHTAKLDTASQDTGVPGLSREFAYNMKLPAPPITEQSAIAAFLDRETGKIDALVAEQERLIALLKEKRQAVISHAVTKGLNPDAPMKDSGIEWLGEVPEHWEVKPLKYSITKIEQGWSPQCESEPADENQWGVLKVGCGNNDSFDPTEQKALPLDISPLPSYEIAAGDILLSRGNTLELVGMATYVEQVRPRLLLCDLLYRFRAKPERAEGKFLVLALRSPNVRFQIERAATGTSATMKKIGQGTIREFVIAFPPLNEQRAIIAFICAETTQLDELTAEAQRAIELLKERRSALISAAVTGKIDVREAA